MIIVREVQHVSIIDHNIYGTRWRLKSEVKNNETSFKHSKGCCYKYVIKKIVYIACDTDDTECKTIFNYSSPSSTSYSYILLKTS